jgi:hypothetical protein
MKKIVIYIFVMLLLSSCTKQRNRTLTVEGTLMANCSTPAANTSGYFHYTGGMTRYTWAEFTTDANGYFKITEKIGGSNLTLNVGNGSGVLRNITLLGNDYLDLGKVYINPPKTKYYLYLEVNNPYNELDTLTYYDWGYPQNGRNHWTKKVAGPFSSGIIDTVHNVSLLNALPIGYFDLQNGIFLKLRLEYFINEYPSGSVPFVEVPAFFCLEDYQKATIVIN